MTERDDIIGGATNGAGEAPAGSGNPDVRRTSDAAKETETDAASPGLDPTGSTQSAGSAQPGSAESGPAQPDSGEAQPAEQSSAAEGEAVEAELDELSTALAERDEYKDLALRAKADFENYRKRADRRVAETRTVAVAGVIRELLPVVDNLDRAVEAAAATSDDAGLGDGVRLVHQDLHAILDRLGLVVIDPVGEQFDPNFHEAISQAPAVEGQAAGCVLEVVQKGFTLGETVVRPARVVVSA